MDIERFIGVPYCPRTMDCADLAMLVQRELFGKAIQLPGRRPRPLRAQEQSTMICSYRDELADRVSVPADGDAVLMFEPGASTPGHIGTYFFLCYQPFVLHTAAWMQAGSTLHRMQDLSALGLTIEGFYRWK